MSSLRHSTAVISSTAQLADDVAVGAYSIIGDNVTIASGSHVASHVVIDGHTEIGKNNQIFPFASLGSAPQDLKFKGEPSRLVIGDNNVIREYVTLQPGTRSGLMLSRIGSNNLFMIGSHVGHDAVVGDGNIFANYCCLAGHVVIEDKVTIGGLSGIHQFVRVGQLSILGAGAMVAQDVPPFCIAQGDHARLLGINKVGVSRAGYSSEDIAQLRKVFRDLFWGKGRGAFAARVEEVEQQVSGFQAGSILVAFVKNGSKRGIAPASRREPGGEEDEE